MESTRADDNEEDYLNDDKSTDDYDEYDEDKSDRASSSTVNSASTTEEPYVVQDYIKTGEAGKSATLKCLGENFDSATIFMWYNGSRLIFQGKTKNTDDPRIDISAKDGTLSIKNINPYDDGSYRCRAYAKQRFETLVDFQVDGPPRGMVISEHKEKNTDISGTTLNYHVTQKDLKFKCSVAKSRPAAKIDWIHNGNTILESQGKDHDLKIEDDNVLIIKNVHARHAGEYQCEASNDFGTLKSSFNVEVECE